jgi:peptidoglycan hydrolase-like protein with peptidoglycan-binding domain
MRRFVLAALSAALVAVPAVVGTAGATAATSGRGVTRPHPTATTWPVVKQGAKGERVRTIQSLLDQRGARIVVDGEFGRSTTAAVKAFQRSRGLVVDGHVGPATWQKLVVTIRRGSRGAAVRALQHQLRFELGYRSVAVDGLFGQATQTAVKNFQAKRKLDADGIVGPATWKALVS